MRPYRSELGLMQIRQAARVRTVRVGEIDVRNTPLSRADERENSSERRCSRKRQRRGLWRAVARALGAALGDGSGTVRAANEESGKAPYINETPSHIAPSVNVLSPEIRHCPMRRLTRGTEFVSN
jgi:hypothetical protein